MKLEIEEYVRGLMNFDTLVTQLTSSIDRMIPLTEIDTIKLDDVSITSLGVYI